MTDATDVALPPPPPATSRRRAVAAQNGVPKAVDGRSREAREARAQKARADAIVQQVDGVVEEGRRRRAAEAGLEWKGEQVRAEAPILRDDQVRARPTRADATRRARRRRENVDKTRDLKLGISFELDPGFEYRWINGGVDDQRIKRLTVDDDWERVSVAGAATDDPGASLRRAVSEGPSGPKYAYLCRKAKDWYETDHRKGQERNDKLMRHIRQGKPPTDISRALQPTDNVYGAEDIRVRESGRDVSA